MKGVTEPQVPISVRLVLSFPDGGRNDEEIGTIEALLDNTGAEVAVAVAELLREVATEFEHLAKEDQR